MKAGRWGYGSILIRMIFIYFGILLVFVRSTQNHVWHHVRRQMTLPTLPYQNQKRSSINKVFTNRTQIVCELGKTISIRH
jgi:hypothetical protein